MANTCKTCRRDDVDEINDELIREVPLRNIVGKRDKLSMTALHRHKDNCIDGLFAEVREMKRAGLLKDVDEVRKEIDQVKVDFPDNPNVRIGLIGKMLDVIDKEAKLTGAYIKDAPNPADNKTIIEETIRELMAENIPEEQIREVLAERYPETVH